MHLIFIPHVQAKKKKTGEITTEPLLSFPIPVTMALALRNFCLVL